MNLVGTGLSSCMLFAMGMVALRNKLDLTGTKVDVEMLSVEKPVSRIGAINLRVTFPKEFSKEDLLKLERAADACPIKHSFHSDVKISTVFTCVGDEVSDGRNRAAERTL